MSSSKLSGEVWYVKLEPEHYYFFKNLADERGDTERGAEARQGRKFLNDSQCRMSYDEYLAAKQARHDKAAQEAQVPVKAGAE